ncbi:MAG: PEP-CTERM sorting domain-containing protein [Phycisphaeraceae bacterium]
MNRIARCLFATCSLGLPVNACAATGGAYDLIYNPADGSLTIDTMGGTLLGYVFVSDGAFFIPQNQVAHFVPDPQFLESVPFQLSDLNPFLQPPLPAGRFHLGRVLPAGWTQSEFNDRIDSTEYVEFLGSGRKLAFEMVYVPEPASLGALGLAGTCLFARRRRAIA